MSTIKPNHKNGQGKVAKKSELVVQDAKPFSIYQKIMSAKPVVKALTGAVIVTCLVMGFLLVPFLKTEAVNSDISYGTEYIDDSTIELGQQQVRQQGENGTKETKYNVWRTLAGREVSRKVAEEITTKPPVNKTIAKGTKKYQFMWCSNGGYRYFTNDQFKDPNTGFTHQSQDGCSQNGQGHMTNLADSAPTPAPIPAPVYQRTAPTTTHCYDTGLYSSSFSCYSY